MMKLRMIREYQQKEMNEELSWRTYVKCNFAKESTNTHKGEKRKLIIDYMK